MKTITDLQDYLSTTFGKFINQLQQNELNLISSFLLTTFANDFPEMKASCFKYNYNLLGNGQRKIYLNDLSDDFLELKMIIPIKPSNTVYNLIRDDQIIIDGYLPLEEVYAIQLASDYIQEMETFYTPKKPLILSDATGPYTTISKDSILFIMAERVLDPAAIPEYIFSVLQPYSCWKFIDFIINRNFGNILEMNDKVFNLMYSSIESDITNSEGMEGIASISLSGLAISYNNRLQQYADALNTLSNSLSNPAFIEEMNKLRDNYLKTFKRKKRLFYNYTF